MSSRPATKRKALEDVSVPTLESAESEVPNIPRRFTETRDESTGRSDHHNMKEIQDIYLKHVIDRKQEHFETAAYTWHAHNRMVRQT